MNSFVRVLGRTRRNKRDAAVTLTYRNTDSLKGIRRYSPSLGPTNYSDIYSDIYGALVIPRPDLSRVVMVNAESTNSSPFHIATAGDGIKMGPGTSLLPLSTSSMDALKFWTTSTSVMPVTIRFF